MTARVEISANGTNWYTDVESVTGIAVGSVDVLVPQRFLKYTRLASVQRRQEVLPP